VVDGEDKSYSFGEIQERILQITPSAWSLAQLRPASIEVQMLPTESGGAMVAMKIKTADREVMLGWAVFANGGFVPLQPEIMGGFGSIFDDQADERLASVFGHAVRKARVGWAKARSAVPTRSLAEASD
jgi:hypothetical protein